MVGRAIIVLCLFVALAVCVVHYRGESIRASAEIQSLRVERIRLQRQAWDLQMQIAALNSPLQILSRVDLWSLSVVSPVPEPRKKPRPQLAEAP